MATINLDQPRYDQATYWGRALHFFSVTNPMNLLASDEDLNKAADVVSNYKKTGKLPPFYDEDRLWDAKSLYDSAFHPDTGEKMFILGRMSAQVPMNTIITGCMITFYKTTGATVFWQWANQSFNALVNYTNRSGSKPISPQQLGVSYVCATGGALATALYLNGLTKSMSPMWGRLVPFGAVCAANCINIPLMRSQELIDGLPVFTADNQHVGESRKAAAVGISLVVISRIFMAVPGMTLTPLFTNIAEKKGLFKRFKNGLLPFQLGMVALCLTFATPLCCALFEQRASIKTDAVEPEIKEKAKKINPDADVLYFNKGL